MSTRGGDGTTLETGSAEETRAIGRALGRRLRPGDCVALTGELGTGKTQLVKGIAEGLGIDPRDVASPTFVLHAVYEGRLTLHHLDAYRLRGAREFEDLAVEENLVSGGVAVIEWADRVREALPDARVEIVLEHAGGDRRRVTMRTVGLDHLDLSAVAREARTGHAIHATGRQKG
ncbi:MAG: tRNA (adenosine(37)-N6)-threonylcarbamoyltransferase complex ATPase subunit type 1 TsaE [Planctomycetota bacterium]